MQFINRFTVFTKRILAHKMYICMLAILVLLTSVYKLLPAKKQATDIKAAIYCEDHNGYLEKFMEEMERSNSIYTFYIVESEEKLLNDVKSSYAECGFFIPDGFYNDFIHGNSGTNPITMYKTPSSMLSASIAETLFANTYQVVAEEILLYSANLPEYNEELSELYHYYTSSDEIFELKSVTDEVFSFKTMIYKIKIPVFEITLLLILFSGLLGLLLYQQDKERKIYLALNNKDLFQIKSLSILTAILPIMVIGIVCNIITNGLAMCLSVLLGALVVFIFATILSFIIRKSTLLSKVLPLIMLISIIGVFVKTIL